MIRKIITPLDGDAKIFSNEQIEVIRKLDRSQVERFFFATKCKRAENF